MPKKGQKAPKKVQKSILSPDVLVNQYADVQESVIMENVEIGERARIRHSIIDKGVIIPPGTVIGYDLDADRARYTVTEDGVVVVTLTSAH